jgi:uncharacterized DUF497 family protein
VTFEWDEAKHAKTLRGRGIGFDDGARIFEGPVMIWQDAAATMARSASGPWRQRRRPSACRVHLARRRGEDYLGAASNRKETKAWGFTRITLDDIKARPTKRDRAKIFYDNIVSLRSLHRRFLR